MKTLVALSLLFLTSSTAIADPDEVVVKEMARRTNLSAEDIRAYYDACDSGVTLPMKICGSYRLMVEDLRMNDLYKRALDKARERGYEASLVRSQRAWLKYREASCAYKGQMGAGGNGTYLRDKRLNY